MNEGKYQVVRKQEIERVTAERDKLRRADIRAVLATEEGRRVLHWVIFEAGGLQAPIATELRATAIAVHDELDRAKPCSPAEIALEARLKRMADDADIQSAIENRRAEYE